ncbi:hypothetical protein ACHAWO_012141 [Cyclotella atomus]|uniref:Uncharacterized protein n=1 Tax=Cyclotella atomus TaxID=382360 RepID=A0ABD3NT45_9STRA
MCLPQLNLMLVYDHDPEPGQQCRKIVDDSIPYFLRNGSLQLDINLQRLEPSEFWSIRPVETNPFTNAISIVSWQIISAQLSSFKASKIRFIGCNSASMPSTVVALVTADRHSPT